jgi:DNA-binding LytR/AlgR family response regulator
MVRVDIRDILYTEGLKDYILIHTTIRKIITLLSLSRMMEKLPEPDFLRVHRSFIVPVSKIESVERNRILIQKQEIPIGDLYREELLKWLR